MLPIDEEQIREALHPLIHNRDGRFLATLSALLSPAYPVAQLMTPDLLLPQNAQAPLENLAKEVLGAYDPWLNGIVPRTALAILWLATHRQDVEPMVARLRGKQNWALILSSSARVSEVTYENSGCGQISRARCCHPHASGFRKLSG